MTLNMYVRKMTMKNRIIIVPFVTMLILMICALTVSCHENAIPITIESDFSGYTFLGYCRISESITLPVLEKGVRFNRTRLL